jgi:hypothetical protein
MGRVVHVIFVIAASLGCLIPSCGGGGDVTALSGCLAKQKSCMVNGQLACVDANKPDYGCNAPPTSEHQCFSCGFLGFAHGTPACNPTNGACDIASCDEGYIACPGQDHRQGCQTSINTDNNNCGACGIKCLALVHQTANTCVSGKCTAMCEAGWTNCAPGMVCDCGPNKTCLNRVCM